MAERLHAQARKGRGQDDAAIGLRPCGNAGTCRDCGGAVSWSPEPCRRRAAAPPAPRNVLASQPHHVKEMP